MSEVAAVIAKIKDGFRQKANEAAALDGKQVQFHLSGDGGGAYVFAVNGTELDVTEGEADSPDLTVAVSKDDFLSLTAGRLGAMQAFMTGKIKIKGDMGLAMKLQSLLG